MSRHVFSWEHSISVASREDHVIQRTEEFDSILHCGLHVHLDEHVGASAKAGNLSFHSVGRRDKVDMSPSTFSTMASG